MKPSALPTSGAVVAALVLLSACQAAQEGPYVQSSVQASPGGKVVPIGPDGFEVPCLVIEAGETVEWRNLTPDVPTNVTSLGEPAELFSPSLVAPYPQVVAERKPGCMEAPTETCLQPPYIWWRHTFHEPGVYEYYDTNQGDPGKKVVDPYYGTVKFVGIGPNVKTGVVCVKAPGSDQCNGVCCVKNGNGDAILEELECPQGQCCSGEKKRCLWGSPSMQVCAGRPAHRELECFTDDQCQTAHPDRICNIGPHSNHTCQPKSP